MTTQTAADRARRRRRITRVLGYVGVTLSFATLAALGLGPRTGQYQVLTVLSGSMAPSISAGSLVVVRPVEPAQLRIGDVITYRIPVQDRRVVTHRVVEILDPGATPTVRTRGDALEEPDAWTTRFGTGPVWRVQSDLPYVGHGLRAMQEPLVRHLMVIGAPALLALTLLARIWRPARRNDSVPLTSSGPEAALHPVPFDGVIVIAPGDVRLPDLTSLPHWAAPDALLVHSNAPVEALFGVALLPASGTPQAPGLPVPRVPAGDALPAQVRSQRQVDPDRGTPDEPDELPHLLLAPGPTEPS